MMMGQRAPPKDSHIIIVVEEMFSRFGDTRWGRKHVNEYICVYGTPSPTFHILFNTDSFDRNFKQGLLSNGYSFRTSSFIFEHDNNYEWLDKVRKLFKKAGFEHWLDLSPLDLIRYSINELD